MTDQRLEESVEFPGVEIPASRVVCKHAARAEIMTQAAVALQTQPHMPMFFAFFPNVVRVFFLINNATGEYKVEQGLRTFIDYTKKASPYLVAFVSEGYIRSYEASDPAAGEALKDPSKIEDATPTISLTVQSAYESNYYVHEIVHARDGTRRLGRALIDTDRREEGGYHRLEAPVDFFNQPPSDMLN